MEVATEPKTEEKGIVELLGDNAPPALKKELADLKEKASPQEPVAEPTVVVAETPPAYSAPDQATITPFPNTGITEGPSVEEYRAELERANARNSTLKGKYNKEVVETRNENKALAEEIAALKAKMAEQEIARSREPLTQEEIIARYNADPSVVEDFGPELIGLIRTVASTEMDTRLHDFDKTRVTPTQDAVHVQARKNYVSELSKLVPSWASINESDEFVDWLESKTERFTGLTYREILDDASDQNDSFRTAEVFKEFLSQVTPKTTPSSMQTPASSIPPPMQTGPRGSGMSAADISHALDDLTKLQGTISPAEYEERRMKLMVAFQQLNQ